LALLWGDASEVSKKGQKTGKNYYFFIKNSAREGKTQNLMLIPNLMMKLPKLMKKVMEKLAIFYVY
jgi:hypothetical protein